MVQRIKLNRFRLVDSLFIHISEKFQQPGLNITFCNLKPLIPVTSTEQIIMVQNMIKLVQVVSASPVMRQRIYFVVGIVKTLRKSSKHGYYCKFHFAVGII